MVFLLRLLRGYIAFSITGSYPERFINICNANGISVWGIETHDGIVYCNTLAVNYRFIKKLSRRGNVKVRVVKKIGVPFFVNKNKDRVGIPIGVVCFLVIFKILSMFVWCFDVRCTENLSEFQIRQGLQDIGVYEGVFNNIDSLKDLQTKAMIEFGDISWLSINIDGSRGEVNISEGVKKELETEKPPCNIIADCDAQILRVDAYRGVAAVVSGDAVVKGDLLISGVVQNEQGKVKLAHSDGVVWARTKRNDTYTVSKSEEYTLLSDMCSERHSLKLFNVMIPLSMAINSSNDSYAYFITEKAAEFDNSTAAVSIINEKMFRVTTDSVEISQSTADKRVKKEMLLREVFEYTDKKIISRTQNCTADDDCFIYEISYEFEEDIGEKVNISTSDNFVIDSESFDNMEDDSESN